jgi:signal transduction histidine kinase
VSAVISLTAWGAAGAAVTVALRLRARLEAVARAEHELRGPVTVLCLACERMRREPAARQHAQALEVELARLRTGLADLGAARHGRVASGPREPVELNRVARSALAAWSPSLREAGRDAHVDWTAGRARVVTDRGRLAQALGNLVANAAEHGTGPIELSGRRVNGGVRVEVRNAAAGGRQASDAERGRGLDIAARAAASAGGRLDFVAEDDRVVAALELPIAEREPARLPEAA